MAGKVFSCPLSGQSLAHPCPCNECPGNLSAYNTERSCAYALPDLGYTTLAEAVGMEPGEVRQASQVQAAELSNLIRDFKQATEHSDGKVCNRCGYLSPCSNQSICDERAAAIEEILVKTNDGLLKPRHLWYAVATQRASFLPRSWRETLTELVSAKDLGD